MDGLLQENLIQMKKSNKLCHLMPNKRDLGLGSLIIYLEPGTQGTKCRSWSKINKLIL